MLRKLLAPLAISSFLFFVTPTYSLAAQASANPEMSENSQGREAGENHVGNNREPENHIREERHSFEGAEVALVGSAVAIAIGLAFLIGRRSRRSK